MRFFALALVLIGCAKEPIDLYPFPAAEDGNCPKLDELPNLQNNNVVGCVMTCRQLTTGGCILEDGTEVGGAPLACLADVALQPLCLRTCVEDSDCGPSYFCSASLGLCVLR